MAHWQEISAYGAIITKLCAIVISLNAKPFHLSGGTGY